MVKTYSKAKDGNTKITPNFLVGEFACSDGSDGILLDDNLPRVLQRIREVAGNKPMTVSSGYRTPAYNVKIGGATNSYHTSGMAADIFVDGVKPLEICRCAETAFIEMKIAGGICLYTKQSFVHIDVRSAKWRGQNDGDGEYNTTGWQPMTARVIENEVKNEVEKKDENDKVIWTFFKGKSLNDFAVAGLMGNLFAESAFIPDNLQDSCEKRLGHTDKSYTEAVDNGAYTRDKFIKDQAGYGLAQWTHFERKGKLYDFIKGKGKSIGDLSAQLDFLWLELQGYTSVMNVLKTATSVRQASDIVLIKYEQPGDQSLAVQELRAKYGQKQYDKFAVQVTTGTLEHSVLIVGGPVDVRFGPGEGYALAGQAPAGGTHVIMEISAAGDGSLWGRLSNGAGWVAF